MDWRFQIHDDPRNTVESSMTLATDSGRMTGNPEVGDQFAFSFRVADNSELRRTGLRYAVSWSRYRAAADRVSAERTNYCEQLKISEPRMMHCTVNFNTGLPDSNNVPCSGDVLGRVAPDDKARRSPATIAGKWPIVRIILL